MFQPAKFMVCPSGDAVSEADLIDKSALHSDVAGGAHASHANCVSSSTDNAARATSAECKKLKGKELDEVKRLIEAHAAVPENMKSAVDCWRKMTPAQQADAYEMHGLGCTGHSVNLTTDDSYKQSESTVLTENMVRDRAARVLQRNFLAKFVRFRTRKARVVFKGYEGPKPAFCGTNRPISLIPDGKNLIGGDLPEVTMLPLSGFIRHVLMLPRSGFQ